MPALISNSPISKLKIR